jgi:hypothetical protein
MDGDRVRVKKTESRTRWRDCGVDFGDFPTVDFGPGWFLVFESSKSRVSPYPPPFTPASLPLVRSLSTAMA